MDKINKEGLHLTSRSLLLQGGATRPLTEKERAEYEVNKELLDAAYNAYMAGESQRNDEYRCERYYQGHQMDDLVTDPETDEQITEEEYILRQGNVPIVVNIIPRIIQPIVGEFCGRRLEPYIVARDTEKRTAGRRATALIKQTYETDCIQQTDNDGVKKVAKFGLCIFRVSWEMNDSRQRPEARVRLMKNNTMFYDDPSGQYFENVELIGQLHDMSLTNVFREFANSVDDIETLRKIFSVADSKYMDRHFDSRGKEVTKNFYVPQNKNKCRVIEVWHKEGFFSYMCHDVQKGEFYYVSEEDRPVVDEINAQRLLEWTNAGGSPDECPLIECTNKFGEDKPIWNTVWVCRYMSPDGHVLKEMVSPYEHGEHPFVAGAMMDGEEISSVEKLILTSQRMTNRLFTRIEANRTAAFKGLKIFDLDVLNQSGVSKGTAFKIASKSNGAMALKHIEGHEPIREYKSQGGSADDVQLANTFINISGDVTGIQGPYRGQEAKSGTPASLFLQETQNASNNIAPLIKWYEGLLVKRNWKLLRVLLQFTDPSTMVRIVGEDARNEYVPVNSDEIRNCDLDMYMTQSSENGPLFISNEDKLYNLCLNKIISPKVYLRSSQADFAEKVLELSEEEERAAMEQQQQAQQMAMQQQAQQQPQIG